VIKEIDRVTNGCLRDLGRESLTYGALVHELSMMPLFVLPQRLIQTMIYKGSVKVFERIKAKQ